MNDTTALDAQNLPVPIVELLRELSAIDVSKYDLDSLPLDSQVELYVALGERVTKAARLYAELTGTVSSMRTKIAANLKSEIIRSGGSRFPHETFDVTLVRSTSKVKDMVVLERLRALLPTDEAEQLFSRKILIESNLPDEVVAKLRATLPGAKITDTVDASGTMLNQLVGTGKRGYGPDSEIGKIISKGYFTQQTGEPYVVVAPRESAMRRAGVA